MKLPLLAALVALTTVPALAQPRLPVPPGLAQRGQQNDVLTWFDRLPARHFAAFGAANRRELLDQKGVIYDKAGGFIEIPMPGDAAKNDIVKMQVKLFRANAGLVVAVSQVVANQARVPGELTIYGVTGAGTLLDVTAKLFPYKLEPVQQDGKITAYLSADLPRNGTSIYTGVPDTDIPNDEYLWDKDRFNKRGDAAN